MTWSEKPDHRQHIPVAAPSDYAEVGLVLIALSSIRFCSRQSHPRHLVRNPPKTFAKLAICGPWIDSRRPDSPVWMSATSHLRNRLPRCRSTASRWRTRRWSQHLASCREMGRSAAAPRCQRHRSRDFVVVKDGIILRAGGCGLPQRGCAAAPNLRPHCCLTGLHIR